jgi:hypothetical protein
MELTGERDRLRVLIEMFGPLMIDIAVAQKERLTRDGDEHSYHDADPLSAALQALERSLAEARRRAGEVRPMPDAAELRRRIDSAPDRETRRALQAHLYELGGSCATDPLEHRLWEAVAAYEETLRQKHGRRYSATRTRSKIANRGVINTLSDWALEAPTPGFKALIETGQARFLGEYVVAEFADRFPPQVVEAAIRKLRDHDVAPPTRR